VPCPRLSWACLLGNSHAHDQRGHGTQFLLRRAFKAFCVLLAVFPFTASLPPSALAADSQTIVATVGDETIRLVEVERLAAKLSQGKKPSPASRPYLQAQLLEQIIARRLVLAYAQRADEAPTAEELAAARAKVESQLAAQHGSLADFLKTRSISQSDFDRQLAWNVVWERYVARYVTPKRLEAFFAAHRRDFDGTEMEVSHILLRPSAAAGKAAAENLVNQAEAIRREIVAGKLAFAAAAQKYSAGPSSKDGGRLGLIGRRAPMDESFSRAAFALEVGEVSPPVKTPFGVHLIRCDQIKPGAKQLVEVSKDLEDALAAELLDKLSTIERRHTPVKYEKIIPHFKPGTHELE
jgi:parvulin-like peptidyl-prolyl isomerase